jgi:hypothetical protein
MPYGSILRRALDITWRHKILWIFGIILAVFGGSSGVGGGQSGARFSGDSDTWQDFGRRMPFGGFRNLDWDAILPVIVGAGLLALFLGLVFLIVSLIARYTAYGSLISGVDEVERTGDTTFNSALRAGWGRFVQLFVIDLLLGIAAFIIALPLIVVILVGLGLVIGPAIAIGSGGEGAVVAGILWGVLTFFIWLAVVILLATVVSAAFTVLREYALRFSVLEGHGIFQSIGSAWRLAIDRLGPTLLMWLILALIGLAVGLVLIPVALVGIGVAASVLALAYAVTESWIVLAVLAIPLLLILGAIVALGSGIYQTFVSAVWTLTFRELRGQETPVLTGPEV